MESCASLKRCLALSSAHVICQWLMRPVRASVKTGVYQRCISLLILATHWRGEPFTLDASQKLKGTSMATHVGFTNVFLGKDGTKYLSGVIHTTANDAVRAQSNPKLVGEVVAVAQVTWEEKDDKCKG